MKYENKNKIWWQGNLTIWNGLLGVILIIFISFNIFVFKTVIDYYSKNSKYPEARAYMASALEMNIIYIYPISKKFGWDSLITKPFYFVRDKLFDIGYSKFPKDEIEKEYWWYAIKYKEFKKLVKKNQSIWGLNFDSYSRDIMYLDTKRENFIAWDKELYNHIDLFAKAKITNKTDKDVAKQKLSKFVDLMHGYINENIILEMRLENDRQVKLGIRKNVGLYLPDSQVVIYDQLYKKYLATVEHSKKYEKESYEYYLSRPDYWLNGEMFVYNLSLDIIQSRFYGNKLRCDDPYLKINVDTHKKIREYYFNHNMSPALEFDAGAIAITVNPLIAYKCRNNPCMQDYIKYILSKQSDKTLNTMEAIKNRELKDLSKEYDRLEQLKVIGIE